MNSKLLHYTIRFAIATIPVAIISGLYYFHLYTAAIALLYAVMLMDMKVNIKDAAQEQQATQNALYNAMQQWNDKIEKERKAVEEKTTDKK